MTPEIEIASASELARRFVSRLSHEAARAIAARGRFALALAGGSATERFVPEWAAADVDWSRCDLFWVDERAVPFDHPDSNYGLARRCGLDRLPLPAANVHPMLAAGELSAAAIAAERELRTALGSSPRIDVALVGVGSDGHVASLFPEGPALRERVRWVAAVTDAPKPPARRLSWTLAAFAAVDLLAVAAFGAEKAAAVAAAAHPGELPIAHVAAIASRRLLLVDPAAARRLPGRRAERP